VKKLERKSVLTMNLLKGGRVKGEKKKIAKKLDRLNHLHRHAPLMTRGRRLRKRGGHMMRPVIDGTGRRGGRRKDEGDRRKKTMHISLTISVFRDREGENASNREDMDIRGTCREGKGEETLQGKGIMFLMAVQTGREGENVKLSRESGKRGCTQSEPRGK